MLINRGFSELSDCLCVIFANGIFMLNGFMDSFAPVLNANVCVICRKDVSDNDNGVSVVTRGLETLTDYSEKYTDTELHHYLLSKPVYTMIAADTTLVSGDMSSSRQRIICVTLNHRRPKCFVQVPSI